MQCLEHNPCLVNGSLKKKGMITGGWNSQSRASITQQDPGHIKDAMKKNEMIPGGWNRQREASKQVLALLKALCRKMIPGGRNIHEEHQESPHNTHEKSCQ